VTECVCLPGDNGTVGGERRGQLEKALHGNMKRDLVLLRACNDHTLHGIRVQVYGGNKRFVALYEAPAHLPHVSRESVVNLGL
jgi:hypothetical protein